MHPPYAVDPQYTHLSPICWCSCFPCGLFMHPPKAVLPQNLHLLIATSFYVAIRLLYGWVSSKKKAWSRFRLSNGRL